MYLAKLEVVLRLGFVELKFALGWRDGSLARNFIYTWFARV